MSDPHAAAGPLHGGGASSDDAIPRTRGPLVALLESRGLRLRRRDGQNFLVEPRVADGIVDAAGIGRADHVIEVGPGAGALTQPLLARAGRVTAVEIDRGLAELLRERLGSHPRLELVHGDALDGSPETGGLHPAIDAALRAPAPGCERTVVVANLPYSAGTEIVVRLLARDTPPAAATIMLQAEVLERIAARPGTEAYGPLAVMTALVADVRTLRRVSAAAFFPRPTVESVVFEIRWDAERRARQGALGLTVSLVRTAFTKRRKTLSNALDGAATPDEIAAAGIDPRARPEDVAPDAWARLGTVVAARPASA